MASRGRGRRGRPRGIGQASSAFNQQAFVEAVGIAVAAIAQACAIVSQGRSNDPQRLEAHRSPMVRGGVDSRVRMIMTTEGEVDDIRGIQDMGACTKRKEDPSSSNPGKKQKTSILHGSQGQGKGCQGQGQDGVFNQAGQVMCYFCRQPGHFQQDCPRRQESQGYGTPQFQSSVRRARVASKDGQMVCYHCQQPGHMMRDCPQRQGSQGFGTVQS